MPEHPGFEPPEQTPPVGRYMPPPETSPAPTYNYPLRTKTPRWVIAVVVGVVTLVVGGIVAGAAVVINAIPAIVESGNEVFGPQPLATGAPQSALAESPLYCETTCFSEDAVPATIIPQSRLDELGLTNVTEEWGDYGTTDALWQYDYLTTEWQRLGSESHECFFTLPGFALAAEFGSPPAGGDLVEFTGTSTSEDEFTFFSQSVRIFPTSTEAVEHMSSLDGLISGCEYYEYDPDVEDWRATVSAAPALTLPSSVSGIGWREANALGRYYVVDLQYANLVVRTAISTYDVISETQYRQLVEELATQLAQLELPQGVA